MTNRLHDAVSPYLRSHAENPVDWFQWGTEPFAEAARRNVPVLVSIGYSTCHWCHVMARESFSDPALADYLNANFVAIKVDREEYPEVDSSYLAAAGAFTGNLGWPLNVFVTPAGTAFYAGTYWPPVPVSGHPAFRQVLEAVTDAFDNRREEVESNAAAIASALRSQGAGVSGDLPGAEAWQASTQQLLDYEDSVNGGFGGAPKFPVAPVIQFLLERGSLGYPDASDLAHRMLRAMAHSELRDPIEGGFFRYSTRRDWSEPHYERMLYDNAQLLGAYSWAAGSASGSEAGELLAVVEGIAGFLGSVMRVGGSASGAPLAGAGAFASAQDSESTVDGERVEGGYYQLERAARARQNPPALDQKILTGWNGMAVEALATAGQRHDRPDWVALAREASDFLLAKHRRPDGTLLRASIGDTVSAAVATLEDYGMFAAGLLAVALATGEVSYAKAARELIDSSLASVDGDGDGNGAGSVDGNGAGSVDGDAAEDAGGLDAAGLDAAGLETATPALGFRAPGGGDPVLAAQGLLLETDPSEGAYPSGLSAMAAAAHTLYLLTADSRYLRAAQAALERTATIAIASPISFGGALTVMTRVQAPVVQLVVVTGNDPGASKPAAQIPNVAALVTVARRMQRSGGVTAILTERQAAAFAAAGFELFAGRPSRGTLATAYLCHDFVCRLPVTDAAALAAAL
ncbi:MAG: thioredoxin domain-containing protein [Microbacteriaceae bacterium]|nr:thioredoxin domain-containing protein [Microbacteriaceae bacterium]